MSRFHHILGALMCLALSFSAFAQEAQSENPIGELPWQVGPAKGVIGEQATINVPDGYAFLDAASTKKLDEILENPSVGPDHYTLARTDLSWLAFFTFNPIGYVKDDDSLDADDLLKSIRDGTEHGNEMRRERGWDTLKILGWSFKPKYDKQINALEWAILAETEKSKSQVVNYNTRLLGRRGVMEVTLVTDPAQLATSIADFKSLVPGYAFSPGEKYAEFKAGDHVAEIGLAALITGGAAAVATKKGFFAAIALALVKLWKLILVGVVAGGAWLRKIFGRKKAETSST